MPQVLHKLFKLLQKSKLNLAIFSQFFGHFYQQLNSTGMNDPIIFMLTITTRINFLRLAMYTTILVIHIIVAISMIGLILIQHGKGADAGASFGGGGSATVFGASGSANFLTRLTAVLTTVFCD